MAYIGMRYPIAAPITSHTDGSAITYGTGFVVGTAVAANVTISSNDSADYGDDVEIDNDNGITDYSIGLETNNLEPEIYNKLLGWEPDNLSTPTLYNAGADGGPDVGFGYIRVKMFKGVTSYEAFWFYDLKFRLDGLNASTKRESIEWNHANMTGNGKGVMIDNTGNAKFFAYMKFATEAEAKTWLNNSARGNIT